MINSGSVLGMGAQDLQGVVPEFLPRPFLEAGVLVWQGLQVSAVDGSFRVVMTLNIPLSLVWNDLKSTACNYDNTTYI
jgi:hypothetical protein